jgi:hypothetical protein
MIDTESTLCSCTDACKHQQKINQYTCCASDNYNCLHACEPDFNFEPDIEHATNDPVSEILPNLPAILNLEDLKQYIQSEIQKAVKPLEEENVRLRRHVSILEGHLNINYADYKDVCLTGNTYEDLKDEGINPFCDRLEALEQRPITVIEKPAETELEVTPTIETTLDMKACAVVEYLKEEMKPNDFGEFVIDRKELSTFMQGIIEEGLRVKKVSRQLKADLFERAVKLFPSIVYIKKSPSGNRTKLLALKTSQKRTITYGMTRTAPIGIIA